MNNYFINKDKKTGEVVYIEYNHEGYKVKPKVQKKDAIEVDKIVFVSPTLTEKLLKKKIDKKISKLLLELNSIDDDDSNSGSTIRRSLTESERLKLTILNEYKKYLGSAYLSLVLEKLELIIGSFRSKLFEIRTREQVKFINNYFDMQTSVEQEVKKGRKGR